MTDKEFISYKDYTTTAYETEKQKIKKWLDESPNRLINMQKYFNNDTLKKTLDNIYKKQLDTVSSFFPELFNTSISPLSFNSIRDAQKQYEKVRSIPTTSQKKVTSTANKIAQASAVGIPLPTNIQQDITNYNKITNKQTIRNIQNSTVPDTSKSLTEELSFAPTKPKSKSDKFWDWVTKEFSKSPIIPIMQAMNLPFSTSTEIVLKYQQEQDKYIADKIGVNYEDWIKASQAANPANRFIKGKLAYQWKQEIVDPYNPNNKYATVEELNKKTAEWVKAALQEPKKENYDKTVEGIGWKDIIGKLVPELAQAYKFTENQNDWVKGTNWLQRILATFIPSPAALAGLVAETKTINALMPKIGVPVGSKTPVVLEKTKPLLAKGGEAVLPGGTPLALSPMGRSTIYPIVKEAEQVAVKGLEKFKNVIKDTNIKQVLTEAGVDVSTKTGKKFLKAMTSELQTEVSSYGRRIAKETMESEIRKLASSLPIKEASKLIEKGGISIFGKTVVSGSDVSKIFKPFINVGSESKVGRWLEGLFWTNKDIPAAFRPYRAFVSSAMRKETDIGFSILKKIRGTLTSGEMSVFDHFVKVRRDVAGLKNELIELEKQVAAGTMSPTDLIKAAVSITSKNKLIQFGESIMPDISIMSDKLRAAIQQYDKEFVQDFLTKIEKKYGVNYKIGEFYAPVRGAKKIDFLSKMRNEVAPEKAAFQNEYSIGGYLKNAEKGIATKSKINDLFSKGFNVKQVAEQTNNTVKDIKSYWKSQGIYDTPATAGFKKIGEASGLRLFEHTNRIGRAMLYDEGKIFGKSITSTDIPRDWVTAKTLTGRIIPELAGMKFSPEMARSFARVTQTFFGDSSFKNIIHFLDEATTLWKRVVLATPGYHLRNFYSDITSGYIEWGSEFFDPKYWVDAIKIKRAQTLGAKIPRYLEAEIILNGEKFTAGELVTQMGRTGEMGTGQTAVESAMKLQPKVFDNRIFNKLPQGLQRNMNIVTNKVPTPLQLNATVGMAREDLGRIVGGLIERNAGSDMIQAAYNVKKVFFDYMDLTAFEREVGKRVIPFYSWMRKNVVRQMEALITRPQRYTTISRYISSITGKKPEGYDFLKPEYFNELLTFVSQGKDELGNPLTTRLNLPMEDMAAWNPKLLGQRVTEGANPFLKIIAEAGIYGIEQWTGKNLRSTTPELAPGLVKDVFGNLPADLLAKMNITKSKNTGELSVTPLWNYFYKQFPWFSMAERSMPQKDNPNSVYQIQSMGLGIKQIPWDSEKAKDQFYNKVNDELNAWITQQNTIHDDGSGNKYVPELPQMEKACRQIYNEAIDKQYADTLNQKVMIDHIGGSKEDKAKLAKDLDIYKADKAKITNKNLIEIIIICKNMGINPTLIDIRKILGIE